MAVSDAVAAYLEDRGCDPDKLEVVPNGVNPARFAVCEPAPRTAEDPFTVSFLGSLKPWHGIGVLHGLEHAHMAGVVHRDVKPHNMLVGLDGQIKLTDFGIARILDEGQRSRITGTGDTLGTIAYMSPEQRLDARAATPAADIFSVGATMYVLLTGRRPFDLAMSTLKKSVLEKVPPELRVVIRRSTAHRPEDRYVTAREMANQLAEVLERLDPDAVFGDVVEDGILEDETLVRVSRDPSEV